MDDHWTWRLRMAEKLASELEVPENRMPNNVVENFGNAASVAIPTAITFNLGETLLNHEYLVFLAGFGAGLSWSSLLLSIGYLEFCEIIEYENA